MFGRVAGGIVSTKPQYRLIGRGVYSLAEAQRLTGVPSERLRRWTRGYTFRYKGEVRHSPPIIATRSQDADAPTLDFSDLLEARLLNAFRRHGVSTWAIRIASMHARELLGRPRPFSTRIFKTDGHTILAELVKEADDPVLLDLVRDQFEFRRIVDPLLYFGIEFDQLQEPARWWPLGPDRNVLLDPERALGAPIAREGVPTAVLAGGVRAEASIALVAEWYRVSLESVRDAVEFEQRLLA